MKTIDNSLLHIPLELESIKRHLKSNITNNECTSNFELANDIGNGNIRHLKLEEGFSALKFDSIFYKDTLLNINTKSDKYIYFMYCIEGICYHNFSNRNSFSKIEEIRAAIVGSSLDCHNQIFIKSNIKFRFSILKIDAELFLKKFEPYIDIKNEEYKRLLKSFSALKNHLHLCNLNLKIAEQLRHLKHSINSYGIHEFLRHKSGHNILLALHLEQYYNELFNERPLHSLSQTELQKIRTLTEYIIDNPAIQHNIKSLCAKVILSPAKLQEGFKATHNKTVTEFVKHVRLEKAEQLLLNTDYNVSEIVYTVGLTSRSYFCKIFKLRFKYSPTAYRSKFKSNSAIVSKHSLKLANQEM